MLVTSKVGPRHVVYNGHFYCKAVMHLSISCPTPTPPLREGGGIDKSSRQIPHPWSEVGCQITTMSPGPSRGFDSCHLVKYCAFAT